jgi:hypothetical protein
VLVTSLIQRSSTKSHDTSIGSRNTLPKRGHPRSRSKICYFRHSYPLARRTNPFSIRQSDHYSGHILLRRQQHPDPRGDDREKITRARQAAEALSHRKTPVSKPSVPETASTDLPQRKPRVLRIISPPAIRPEEVKTSVSCPDPHAKPAIPRSHFPRIRTWLRYGMTITEVAAVYGVEIGEIERILAKT